MRHPPVSAPVLPIALVQPGFGGSDGPRGTRLDRVAAPLIVLEGAEAGAVKEARHPVCNEVDERSVLCIIDLGNQGLGGSGTGKRIMVHLPGPGKRAGLGDHTGVLRRGRQAIPARGLRSEVFAVQLAVLFLIVLNGVVVLDLVRRRIVAHRITHGPVTVHPLLEHPGQYGHLRST